LISSGYVKEFHMLQWQLMQIIVAGEGWLQCSLIMNYNPQSRQVFFCAGDSGGYDATD